MTRLGVLAVVQLALAACAFFVKARLFPGFDAFALNFSGNGWDHVSTSFVLNRALVAVTNPNIVPVLIGCSLLAVRDIRYLIPLLLLSPLYLLHMLSVRPEHGHYTLYYALPWLIPSLTSLALFVTRVNSHRATLFEGSIILLVSFSLAAPIHAAFGSKRQFWYVAQEAFTRPVVDIQSMKEFALWVQRTFAAEADDGAPVTKNCASIGIAALIPNNLRPDEVVDGQSDLANCRFLLLLNGDMSYGVLRQRAQTAGFDAVASRYNAQLWLRRTK